LKHFGSVDKIRDASVEDLRAVVPEGIAQSIKAHLE
jgi:excinuclease UvrABC nuclease subunit